MNKPFWKDKRVLLTGHTGFKGSWLSLWLTSMGARVTGLALEPEAISLFNIAKVAQCIEQHNVGDIRNESVVARVFQSTQPEIVLHLAAQPLVLASYADPITTYATNVMGTAHILNCARQTTSVKSVVNVTTDKCYENKEWLWGYRENDRLGGHDPYSNSKACAELVTSAFRDSWFRDAGVGLASARAGNVIGGGDWAGHRLVPDIIQAIVTGKPALIRNPKATRPWQHVLEPLSGYLLLAERVYQQPTEFSLPFNFGPHSDDVKPVDWIADYVVNRWGQGARWELHNSTGAQHEAGKLMLDSSRAQAVLNWHPKWSLAQALDHTIEWYTAWHTEQNMQDFTLQQICLYNS